MPIALTTSTLPPRGSYANRGRGARGQRGMSLIEVLVVIAILLAVGAVLVMPVSSYLMLQQNSAARTLATTYELLHDEAVLRNVTFRIAYHLDEGFYDVEVGRPETLIFNDPEARQAYEEKLKAERDRLSTDEKPPEPSPFQRAADRFETHVALPRNTAFGGVYTPQYGELQKPRTEDEKSRDEDEPPRVAYSYIFPNGFAEHAVIQVVSASDPEDGYTIEVEPMSGRVHLYPDLRNWEEFNASLPERGPELPE
jgi:prepilin-type N-terminal cleavage/methylation domain-containing protein